MLCRLSVRCAGYELCYVAGAGAASQSQAGRLSFGRSMEMAAQVERYGYVMTSSEGRLRLPCPPRARAAP
jgi:hypothetical protein